MKTQFEFIHFVEVEKKPKTSVWTCRNTKSMEGIGTVMWYPAWRQYCFVPWDGTVFSVGCMKDIISFIKEADAIRTGTHEIEPIAHTSTWGNGM
jgi:hypothetical protein